MRSIVGVFVALVGLASACGDGSSGSDVSDTVDLTDPADDGADAPDLRDDGGPEDVASDETTPDDATGPDAEVADAGTDDGAEEADAEDGRTDPCDPSLGPSPPVGTDDATYTEWTRFDCLTDACLCSEAGRPFVEALLACDAVQGGYWWGLGSVYVRVVGRSAGACVLELGGEVEGGVSLSRCILPLPLTAWPGLSSTDGDFLDGISDRCAFVASCCLLDGCPDPCSSSGLDVPLCPPGAGIPCAP